VDVAHGVAVVVGCSLTAGVSPDVPGNAAAGTVVVAGSGVTVTVSVGDATKASSLGASVTAVADSWLDSGISRNPPPPLATSTTAATAPVASVTTGVASGASTPLVIGRFSSHARGPTVERNFPRLMLRKARATAGSN